MERNSELTIGKTVFLLIFLLIIQSILVLLVTFIYGLVYSILNSGVDTNEIISIVRSSNLLDVIIFVIVELSFLLFAVILVRKYNKNIKALIRIEKINFSLSFFLFLFSISFLVVSSELENIFASLFGRMDLMGDFITNVSGRPGLLGLIAAVFTVDIIPAIAEESLFRGVFLENLKRRYGFLRALIVVSVLFAIMHINPSSLISIFLFALALGYVYLKTEKLIYPIMLHFFYNGFATLLLRTKHFEINGLSSSREMIEHVPVPLFLTSLVLSILFFIIIYKILKNDNEIEEIPNPN